MNVQLNFCWLSKEDGGVPSLINVHKIEIHI